MVDQGEVAELWIVFRRRDPTPPYTARTWARRIDDGVAPTVNAYGIAGIARHQYHLAPAPPPGALIADSL